MSHVHEGPIAAYNSLHDGHLSSYFGNTRIKKHLVRSGLITKDGRLVSEEQYRLQLARREHKRMVKEMLSQAIVQRTLEVERQRQAEIKKKLEEIAKMELVKRVRASRGRRGDEEVLQFLLPLPSRNEMKRSSTAVRQSGRHGGDDEEFEEYQTPSEAQDDSYVRDRNFDCFSHLRRRPTKSAYPKEKIEMTHWTNLDRNAVEEYNELTKDVDTLPALAPYNHPELRRSQGRQRSVSPKRRTAPRSGYRQYGLHRPGSLVVLHEAKVRSLCEVKMKFLGLGPTSGPASAFHEVSIEQQHCGGNTLTVFRGKLSEGDEFTFVSRRHLDFPFSLTVYVDSVVDCRLSSCCEYKHRWGQRLGGPNGHFKLLEVRGASACYKCQTEAAASGRRNSKDSEDQHSLSSDAESRPQPVTKPTKPTPPRKPSTKPKRRPSKTAESVGRTNPPEPQPSSPSTPSRQEAVVRLPDSEPTVSARNSISKQTRPNKQGAKSAEETSYDREKFEDDDDEPDKHSNVVIPKHEPSSPKVHQPAPAPIKHSVASHPPAKSLDNSNLLATITKASIERQAFENNDVEISSPATAIVKLPNKLSEDRPGSSHPKHLSSQQTLSFHHQAAVHSPAEPAVSKREVIHDEMSIPSTPIRQTPVASPLLSPTVTHASITEHREANFERPSSPQQSSNKNNASILKKSVSFNEVRLERQISDEERYSPEAVVHTEDSPAAKPPVAVAEPEDEEDDPNAVANHEAALLLEEQQKAGEDRTPFLQPGAAVLDINKQTLSDRQIRRLCAEIHNSDRLEKIVIRESGLNDGMVQRICDALANSSNAIRLLCLNLNAVSAAGIVHVVQLLHSKPSIKMLLLYGNPLGDNGLNALVDGIFGDLPEELINSMAAQGINIPQPKEDEPVRINLTHLDLGEIGISSAGAIKFAKLLERLPTLRVLNLGGNHNVGLEGWSAIAKALAEKAYPAKLCLSHCRLGNKCTLELATALRTNTGVENIDLEGCGIGDEGGRALLDLVKLGPPKLDNIVLADNRIDERIAHQIDRELRKLRGEDDEEEEEQD